MENLIFSINVVLPLFLIMCLGTFLRKINIYDEIFLKKANNFVFKVLMPALLFYNIYSSNITDSINIKLLAFAISTIFAIVGIAFIIVPKFEKNNKNRGVLIQGLFRSNFVLLGIPLISNIFGNEGIGVTTMLIAIGIPVYNFLAVIILDIYTKEKLEIKQTVFNIIKNPLIISSVTGILFTLLNIKLPLAVEKTVADVAKISTPLALMLLGGEFQIGKVYKNIKYILFVCIGKLIVIPIIVIPIGIALGFKDVELGAIFAMIASPVAVSSFTMAQQAEANYELAGQIVFMSTIFSSITIFMFIFVFKTMGIF